MRRLAASASVLAGFLAVLSAAGATAAGGGSALTLSPQAVDLGQSLHAGESSSARVTVSNPTGATRLITQLALRDTASGCSAFGSACPLRIVSQPGSCPSYGPLAAGQSCRVTLAFDPAAAGRLGVSFCVDSLGPLGEPQPPASARACVSVGARVSAATPPAAPRGGSPPRTATPTRPATPPSTSTPTTPSTPPRTSPSPKPTPMTSPTVPHLQPVVPSVGDPVWRAAGAFVWHPDALDPSALGREMRSSGFGWVAIRVQDGSDADSVSKSWISRFRQASGGLLVGGWGVLRDRPYPEAQLAAQQVDGLGLDFYIADAELEYEYTNGATKSKKRYQRSGQFVAEFRSLEPNLPGAVSSYCRADMHDIDWASWRSGGFSFLPQAYVDQFGQAAAPATCAAGAAAFFAPSDVHPTLGTFPSTYALPSPAVYGQMLQAAGTVGFSLYLAEDVPAPLWRSYGQAIASLSLAG